MTEGILLLKCTCEEGKLGIRNAEFGIIAMLKFVGRCEANQLVMLNLAR